MPLRSVGGLRVSCDSHKPIFILSVTRTENWLRLVLNLHTVEVLVLLHVVVLQVCGQNIQNKTSPNKELYVLMVDISGFGCSRMSLFSFQFNILCVCTLPRTHVRYFQPGFSSKASSYRCMAAAAFVGGGGTLGCVFSSGSLASGPPFVT